MKTKKLLTTLTAAGLILAVPLSAPATGIPVFDGSNLAQNLVTAFNAVKSTAVQAEQYAVQIAQKKILLDQYIQQLKDGLGITDAMRVYQLAQQTMAELQGLQYQFQNAGQLTSMLNQFQDVNYWMRTDPSRYGFQTAGSTLQKQTDDAWVKSLAAQQQYLQRDAANLERMQTVAQNAGGQMQAIQAASQIAANEAEQLMEIRALMISEQNALAARQQTLANEEAMRQAATEKYNKWNYQPTSNQPFRP
jgi:P-type conjugative transfer protein TrbJ